METIKIPDEQVIPIETVASDIRGLRIAFVNIFAVTNDDGSWTLIDAALPFTETLIRNWAEKHFGSAPTGIVLTHGHFDHVSAAKGLAEHWNVPVYAHPLEFPYLTGQREYPAPNVGAGGGLMSLLSPTYPRGPIDLGQRLRALPVDDAGSMNVHGLEGWQVIQTPGHTPGHVSFFRPSDRTLLAGDAFCTTKPESFFEAALLQNAELHGPPAYFTWDWDKAHESVRRLAELNPLVVAPGHGKPLTGEQLPSELRRLATDFNQIAVPANRQ